MPVCRIAVAKKRKLAEARGMSSVRASDTGLPVSSDSASASSSSRASIRSAIRSRRPERTAGGSADQAGNAARRRGHGRGPRRSAPLSGARANGLPGGRLQHVEIAAARRGDLRTVDVIGEGAHAQIEAGVRRPPGGDTRSRSSPPGRPGTRPRPRSPRARRTDPSGSPPSSLALDIGRAPAALARLAISDSSRPVRVEPGRMLFTVMPYGASSLLERLGPAGHRGADGVGHAEPLIGSRTEVETMLTIRPYPASRMPGTSSWTSA